LWRDVQWLFCSVIKHAIWQPLWRRHVRFVLPSVTFGHARKLVVRCACAALHLGKEDQSPLWKKN
jgi:hypothetical protein